MARAMQPGRESQHEGNRVRVAELPPDPYEAEVRWARALVNDTRRDIAKLTSRFVTADEHDRTTYRDALVVALRELTTMEARLQTLLAEAPEPSLR